VIRYAAAQSLRRIPIRRVACHAIRVAQRVVIIYVARRARRR
jgi:hypothetical protein